MTTEERLKKYPKSNYDPMPNCRKCKGVGEYRIEKLNRMTCCICIFVDHQYCDEIGKQIAGIAKRELEKLRSER